MEAISKQETKKLEDGVVLIHERLELRKLRMHLRQKAPPTNYSSKNLDNFYNYLKTKTSKLARFSSKY